MMRQTKVTLFLPYTFTAEEKVEIATKLAQANQKRTEAEETKKRVDADLKAQIEEQISAVNMNARLYANGYEYRNIDCQVDYDTPVKGKKTIIRLDTGELVEIAFMSGDEMQEELPLEPIDPPLEEKMAAAQEFAEGMAAEEPAAQGPDPGF